MPSKEKVATPIIGRGEEMRALRALIATVANSQATVLISGESGTGKELIARALHDESDRAGSRFVPVNCAAIRRELDPDRGRAKRVSGLRVSVDRAKSGPHPDQNVVSAEKSIRIGGARSAFQHYEYA